MQFRQMNGKSTGGNSTADLESELDIVKSNISNIEPTINANQNAISTNTASIASLADYWQFDTLPTDDTTNTFFGPLGKIRVQSVPVRLWNTKHAI